MSRSQIRATVEPFRDFKIDLTASRTVNTARSIQYMFDGMPATQTGSFNITTISISSAFASLGNADNNYENKTFRKFLNLLPKFRDRVEAQYIGAPYPTNSAFAGKTFDPANGTISQYSSDVMIPAFLAAYCGGGENSSLDIFPSLLRMLPNWKVTYSGLGRLRFMRPIFKSFNTKSFLPVDICGRLVQYILVVHEANRVERIRKRRIDRQSCSFLDVRHINGFYNRELLAADWV